MYLAGTLTTATLYSDEGVTPKSNPTTTDSKGVFSFYIEDGRYDIQISGTGLTTYTQEDVEVADIKDLPVTHAHMYQGADAGAKIIAAMADLPSTGGVVDARGLEGAQTISSNIFAGLTKPGKLLLGSGTYTVTAALVMNKPWKIEGVTQFETILNYTPTSGDAITIDCGYRHDLYDAGLFHLRLVGPGKTSSTGTGVVLGHPSTDHESNTRGASGVSIEFCEIRGFQYGVRVDFLVQMINVFHSSFINNVKAWYHPSTNSDQEGVWFTSCLFGDDGGPQGGGTSPQTDCFDVRREGAIYSLVACHFDACHLRMDAGFVKMVNGHFENVDLDTTNPFITIANGLYSSYGTDYVVHDTTTDPDEIVSMTGGAFQSFGDQLVGASGNPLTAIVKVAGAAEANVYQPGNATGYSTNNFFNYVGGWTGKTLLAMDGVTESRVGGETAVQYTFGVPGTGTLNSAVNISAQTAGLPGMRLQRNGVTKLELRVDDNFGTDAWALVDKDGDVIVDGRPSDQEVRFKGNVRLAAAQPDEYAFGSIPAARAVKGNIVRISDSDTATWGDTISGGSSNEVVAVYDGANWLVMGLY